MSRSCICGLVAALAAVLLVLAGCDGGGGEEDAGLDGALDGDAGQDAGEDAGQDAGEDAGQDAGEDAGQDAGEDAGQDAGEDAGQDAGEDAGQDAGEDAGQDAGEDAGDDVGGDEGATPAYGLTLLPLDGWQRGPVRLELTAAGPDGEAGDVGLSYSLDGSVFQPATALAGSLAGCHGLALDPAGVPGRCVWDSKVDLDVDAQVWLRASLRVGGVVRATDELGPVDLHDARDFDRPGLVAHFYGPGASLLWLRADGSLEDSGLDLATPERASLVAFTADGRFGAVLAEGDGGVNHTLTPFAVARDGTISALGGTLDIQALDLMGSDLVPAPDGSGLWLTYRTGEGGLFFLSFEGGLPALREASTGGYLLLPLTLSAGMAILPDNQRALVSGGALGIDDPPYDLTLVDLQAMSILDQQVAGVGSLADTVAVTSDGALALVPAADPWNDPPDHQVLAVRFDGDTISGWSSVPVVSPARVAIHPQDGAALVTSWDQDAVYVLDLSAGAPVQVQSLTVGLADHITCVREGSLAGLCLVSSVTELVPLQLSPDASVVRGTSLAFGGGNAGIVYGSAFQP
jgi:hypothetical protein